MVTGVQQQCSILVHRVVLAAATDECTTVWESLSLSHVWSNCCSHFISLFATHCPLSSVHPLHLVHPRLLHLCSNKHLDVHQVVPLLSFHRFPREPFFIFSACQSLHIRCSKILVKLCPKKSSSKDDEHYNVQLVVQVART